MGIRWSKLIFGLAFILAMVQILHLFLLNRLDQQKNKKHFFNNSFSEHNVNEHRTSNLKYIELQPDYLTALKTVRENSVLDSSGHFLFARNVFKPSRYLNVGHPRKAAAYSKDVSVVTHSTLNQLPLVVDLIESWEGPTSIAVFTPDNNQITKALYLIAKLRECNEIVKQFAIFHLVYPFKANANIVLDAYQDDSCAMDGLVRQNQNYNLSSGIPYPNNLLRNVAKNSSPTQYVLIIDVDFILSHNIRTKFLQFTQKHQLFNPNKYREKVVYVLPAFEVKHSIAVPNCKEELVSRWKSADIRAFYSEVCWKCQGHTDYEAWLKIPVNEELSIAFEVLWKDPWEPFYIASKDIPAYDERFQQYGFNRISQVCELHVAGYKFAVLNEGFVVHRGLKTPGSFHPSKEADQERNRILYRLFKEELKSKYPQSSRRCY